MGQMGQMEHVVRALVFGFWSLVFASLPSAFSLLPSDYWPPVFASSLSILAFRLIAN
jgi:hypothetical protein